MSAAEPALVRETVAEAGATSWRRVAPAAGACVLAVLGALLAAAWGLDLQAADLDVPFVYRGDGVSILAITKGMIETDDFPANPALGAPWGSDLRDYPLPEVLNLATLELLGELTGGAARSVNLHYLLGFPLAALGALLALRGLGVGWSLATPLAVLYAAAPYHFQRGESHLFLSFYFVAPLALLVACWLATGSRASGRWWSLSPRRSYVAVGVCLLLSVAGAYYAFFGSFFLLVAGAFATIVQRRIAPLVTTALLVALVTVGLALQLVPHLRYRQLHGDNTEVAQRAPGDAQRYGLRVVEMLVPVDGHRVRRLAELAADAARAGPEVSERSGNLGLVGAAGFGVLLFWLLVPLPGRPQERQLLATLNGAGVLLGTTGGMSAVLELLGSSSIRGYNRISIFLAFLALATVGLLLEAALSRRRASGCSARLAVAVTLLAVGLPDQLSPLWIPDHAALKAQWANDRGFVTRLEHELPRGAMIFQLPYVAYPESPPRQRMADYDHFRAYLHSRDLRWSYGSMRGRPGDAWQRDLAARPAAEMVAVLGAAGFAGILVDRFGYAEPAREVEAELVLPLGPPQVSHDGRLAFFRLRRAAGVAIAPPQLPATIAWEGGFSVEEHGAEGQWRWCSEEGTLVLMNPAGRPLRVRLTMTVATGHRTPSHLWIEGPGALQRVVSVDAFGAPVHLDLLVPPAGAQLRLRSDAPLVVVPGDPRRMVFRVLNWRLATLPG